MKSKLLKSLIVFIFTMAVPIITALATTNNQSKSNLTNHAIYKSDDHKSIEIRKISPSKLFANEAKFQNNQVVGNISSNLYGREYIEGPKNKIHSPFFNNKPKASYLSYPKASSTENANADSLTKLQSPAPSPEQSFDDPLASSGATKTQADRDIESVRDKIKNWDKGYLVVRKGTSIQKVSNPKELNAATLRELSPKTPMLDDIPVGVDVTYTHEGLDHDDNNFVVKFKIEKSPGKTLYQDFKVLVLGIDANKADKDIKLVEDQIKGWTSDQLNISKNQILPVTEPNNLDKSALKALAPNLEFPSNLHGTNLTYTHSGITSDGKLIVNVEIKKEKGTTVKHHFEVQVSGINKTKANNDIKLVKDKMVQEWVKGHLTTEAPIPAVTQPKNLDEDAFKALAPDLEFLSDLHGTSLTYTHGGTTNNGQLKVHVEISKTQGTTESQDFTVQVSGIDETQANKYIKLVEDQIKGWPTGNWKATNETSIPAVTQLTTLDEKALKKLAPDLDFPVTTHQNILSNLYLKYKHDGITSDGFLIITVEIKKSPGTTKTQTFKVKVSGIDKNKANNDIKSTKDEISNLNTSITVKKASIPAVKLGTEFDEDAFKDLFGQTAVFPNLPQGVKLKYSHDLINNDGTLKLKFKIEKSPGTTLSQDFEVWVSGINKTKANNDIKLVKDKIKKGWTEGHLTTTETYIPPITQLTTLDEESLKKLAPDLKFLSDLHGTSLTYTHGGITSDGPLTVHVEIKKSLGTTLSQDFVVQVSGINNAKLDNDIKLVKDIIVQEWVKGSLTTEAPIPAVTEPNNLDKSALKALAPNLKFPSNLHGTSLFYTHGALNKDGKLTIDVTISKGSGKSLFHNFKVDVLGINASIYNNANKDIGLLKDAIDNIGVGNLTSTSSIVKVQNPKPFDEKALKTLAPDLEFPSNLYGTSLTYTHGGITSNGTLTISVQISKSPGTPVKQDFDVQVIGIDETKANNDIKLAQDQIKVWTTGNLTSTKPSIPAVKESEVLDQNALRKLAPNLTFPQLPSGVSLTYTHQGLVKNGTLKVHVKISKSPGMPLTHDFQVEVNGIKEAIYKQADNDIKLVQDQIKKWTKGMLTVSKTSIPAVTTTKELVEGSLNNIAQNIPKLKIPNGVYITYTHQGLEKNGLLTFHFAISKPLGTTVTQDFVVQVSGIDETKANNDIKLVQDQIKKWSHASLKTSKTSITPTSTPRQFDAAALRKLAPNLTFPQLPSGVSLTYTHNGALKNGPLNIFIEISKSPGTKATQNFVVQVTGIDEINAQNEINSVQTIIKKWDIGNSTVNKESIPAVKTPKPFDGSALFALAPDLQFPSIPVGVKVLYTHNGITSNGILKVHVKISKSPGTPVTQDFETRVSGIDIAKKFQANKDIALVKDQIKKIWSDGEVKLTDKIPSQSTPRQFDAAALRKLAPNLTFPQLPSGVSLTYTHQGLVKNGTLKVHVKISKSPGTTVTQDFEVQVSGIDETIKEANDAIKSLQSQINSWKNADWHTSETVIESKSNSKFEPNFFDDRNIRLKYPTSTYGAKLTYSHEGIKKDGTLKISVKIEKYPGTTLTEEFDLEVKGINIAKDIESVQKQMENQIKTWNNKNSLKISDKLVPPEKDWNTSKPFNSKALKSLFPNLDPPLKIEEPKETKLTYTIEKGADNNHFKIKVKISKSKQSRTEVLNVSLISKDNEDAMDYSKTGIILMSFFGELLLISIIVLIQIIKSKKRV